MTIRLKLILSVLAVLIYAAAMGDGKNPQKANVCKHKYPTKMEDLIFMFPGNSQQNCTENSGDINKKSVVEFYRWYLKNEPKFDAYSRQQKNNLDFIPPFNITWQEMQQYVNFIRKTYPEIDTVHVTSGAPNKITATRQDTNISFGEDIYH